MTPPSRPQIVFSGLNHNGGRDHAQVICAGFYVYFICGRSRKNVKKKSTLNSQTKWILREIRFPQITLPSFILQLTHKQDHYQVDDLDTVAVA